MDVNDSILKQDHVHLNYISLCVCREPKRNFCPAHSCGRIHIRSARKRLFSLFVTSGALLTARENPGEHLILALGRPIRSPR